MSLRYFLGRIASYSIISINRLAADYRRTVLRTKLGHVGSGGALGDNLQISAPDKVWLGNNVHIGRDGWIRAEGGLTIGDNTHISRNVTIYTVNHDYRGSRLPYDEKLVCKPVVIGENVWIGMNVSIAPGTTIGEGAIIALGACVSGEVPPLVIVGQPSWRILGRRDSEYYWLLKNAKQFGGPDGIAIEPIVNDNGGFES